MKNRDYSKLTWDQLTPEEKTRFKIRYTVLKFTEIITVVAIGFATYFLFIK